MPIKLAVPENSFSENIYAAIEGEQPEKNAADIGVQLIKTTEDKAQRMLANREVDAALITPLSFAKMSDTLSLRVIPTYCVAPEDFTGAATIYFKSGANGVESIGSAYPHSYLSTLSKILLNELYGIEANIEKSKSNKDDILDEHDVAIIQFDEETPLEALDLSEEWLQLYKNPLPLYFWACWADNQDKDIKVATEQVAPSSIPAFKEVRIGEDEQRHGRLHFLWHEKIEQAIDHALEILFYNQYSNQIHSIKLFDHNEGKEIDITDPDILGDGDKE